MAMELRDGKLYSPSPASKMSPRGKQIVNQAYFVKESSILYDNDGIVHDSVMVSTMNRGTTPKKKGRFGGIEARKIGTGKRTGLTPTMSDNYAQDKSTSLRYTSIRQNDVSDIINKTSEFTTVTSNKKLVIQGGEKSLRLTAADQTTKGATKKTKGKNTRLSLGNGDFTTSTPLTSVAQNYAHEDSFEDSFVISERRTLDTETVERKQAQNSFTKITKKPRKKNNIETPLKRQSAVSSSGAESIEDSIFEDLSKPIIYSNDEHMSDINLTHEPGDLSKGMSFSYWADDGGSPSVNLNHPRWSNFHHWRREWYLNRWSMTSVRAESKLWLQRVYARIFSILISIQTFIATQVSYLKSIFRTVWVQDVKVTRKRRRGFRFTPVKRVSHRSTKSAGEDSASFCSTFCIPALLGIIAFLLMNFLLWPHNISFGGSPVFNLTNHGIKHARCLTLNVYGRKFLAWHVPPFGEAFSNDNSVAGNKFPVAYYVQNIHNQSIARKSEIFKALSHAGYNVIIPVYPDSNLAGGWKKVRMLFNKSATVVLWGEKGAVSDMQVLARELCREGFPPSGVVIETEERMDKNFLVTELEVWSCNCTTVQLDNGKPFPYSHVKCPLEIDRLSKDIVHCLQALRL